MQVHEVCKTPAIPACADFALAALGTRYCKGRPLGPIESATLVMLVEYTGPDGIRQRRVLYYDQSKKFEPVGPGCMNAYEAGFDEWHSPETCIWQALPAKPTATPRGLRCGDRIRCGKEEYVVAALTQSRVGAVNLLSGFSVNDGVARPELVRDPLSADQCRAAVGGLLWDFGEVTFVGD